MDNMQQQRPIRTDSRPSAPPGQTPYPSPGPARLAPPLVSPSGAAVRVLGLGPDPPAPMSGPAARTDWVRPASASAPPLNISRPRPTVLSTKPLGRTSRASTAPSAQERASAPARIPGPHSPISLAQSPTEPCQSPGLSPHQPLTGQPVSLSPQSSRPPPPLPPLNASSPSGLGPKLSSGSRPGKVGSPGTSEDQPHAHDKTGGESDDFRVHIVTWNVGSAVPPDDITSLFGPNAADGSIDMFVVGLQEVNSMINMRLKDALFSDQWSELCMETLSRFGFVLVASQRMQGVLLLVFSKFRYLPFLRGVQTESTKTGLGGYWGNKGGVSARMMMYGHPVCFLNCHLPAHMRNLEQRMEDFESILQQQQFHSGSAAGVLDHDVVFWFGDLNFRIEDYDIHVVKSAIESNKLPLLWERDQLNMAKNSESILEGFHEGPLKFPPTYKFDVGTHTYDTSGKKRKPAWTDRILWRLRRTGSPVPTHNAALQRGLTSWLGGATRVTQHAYRSHMGYTISDHKPVSALFSLHFPFKVDIPLVTFERVEREWTSVCDAAVSFAVASNYQRSSMDWVAIYNVRFKHHKDYVVNIYVDKTETQVTFTEEELPRDTGEYILGFYSNNMSSIVGVTVPFQIRLPVRSPGAAPGPSDSSAASSEDDSTLVLLAPSSRSPSPGASKHRHHRRRRHHHRRSRSPAVPAAPLPSLQGLSLRPREGASRSRSPCAATVKKERLVISDTLTSPSSASPLSPRSPASPGGGVTAPEALIAAILGEAAQVSPTGAPRPARIRDGETSL